MIARIWRGLTRDSQAEEYFEYLKATGIKEYRETQGNQGVFVTKHHSGAGGISPDNTLGIMGCYT